MVYTEKFSTVAGDPNREEKERRRLQKREADKKGDLDLLAMIAATGAYSDEQDEFNVDDFLDPEGTGDEGFEDFPTSGHGTRPRGGAPVEGGTTSSGSDRSGQSHTEHYNSTNAVTDLAEKNNPLSGFRMSSGYGVRDHPVSGKTRDHKGIDIAAPSGTDVKAATDAKVAYSGWAQGYGNIVILSHGSGVYSLYAHLTSSDVRTGDTVRAGQKFADVGNTGVGTGAHLHYELMVKHGQTVTNVNPSKFSLADLADPTMRQRAVSDAERTLNNASSRVAGRIQDGGYGERVAFTRETAQLASAAEIPHDAGHDHAPGEEHHDDEPASPAAPARSPASTRPAFAEAHTPPPAPEPKPAAAPAAAPGVFASVGNWLKDHNPLG